MDLSRACLHVRLGTAPLPYWFEYPPFLWGEGVNFDSDGDAYDEAQPAHWTILHLQHRHADKFLSIKPLPDIDNPPMLYRDAEGHLRVAPPPPSREEVSIVLIESVKEGQRDVLLAAWLTALRSRGTVLDPQTSREIPVDAIAATIEDLAVRIETANKVRSAWTMR